MKALPPPILIETWLFIIFSDEKEMSYQKFKLRKTIKELFGSIELAQLYIEQITDQDIEIHFI